MLNGLDKPASHLGEEQPQGYRDSTQASCWGSSSFPRETPHVLNSPSLPWEDPPQLWGHTTSPPDMALTAQLRSLCLPATLPTSIISISLSFCS